MGSRHKPCVKCKSNPCSCAVTNNNTSNPTNTFNPVFNPVINITLDSDGNGNGNGNGNGSTTCPGIVLNIPPVVQCNSDITVTGFLVGADCQPLADYEVGFFQFALNDTQSGGTTTTDVNGIFSFPLQQLTTPQNIYIEAVTFVNNTLVRDFRIVQVVCP